jgi:hypothetical protein
MRSSSSLIVGSSFIGRPPGLVGAAAAVVAMGFKSTVCHASDTPAAYRQQSPLKKKESRNAGIRNILALVIGVAVLVSYFAIFPPYGR